VSQSVERTALAAISAVERRDGQSLSSLYAPDIAFDWPPGLPYSGVYRGDAVLSMHEVFAAVWDPLQPTMAERSMDPIIVASSTLTSPSATAGGPCRTRGVQRVWTGGCCVAAVQRTHESALGGVDGGRTGRASRRTHCRACLAWPVLPGRPEMVPVARPHGRFGRCSVWLWRVSPAAHSQTHPPQASPLPRRRLPQPPIPTHRASRGPARWS
jgi:hypothetical protein